MGVAGAASRSVSRRSLRAAALCLLAALSLLAWNASPASANRLRVLPFPGTPDASPSSEIVLSAVKPSDVLALSVTGSTTGGHAGRLSALPDGAGTAFVPYRPFAPGEVVQVHAALTSPAAGTASGAPGMPAIDWSFTVAVAWGASPQAAADRAPVHHRAATPQSLSQHFHSRPDLHPPLVGVTRDGDTGSGDIFLSPNHDRQSGGMILDGQGRLVWFDHRSLPVYNLEVQRYHGQPVLTWWQGNWLGGGEDVILDSSYRRVAVVHAGEGYAPDLHEFQVTPQGTALVDIYSPVQTDTSGIGGTAAGAAMDCIIQEVDIQTGAVLWEWHALGHVALSASHAPVPKDSSPFDYFHINSIQQLPNGNLVVSSRSDWAVYEISKRTGNVIWSVGGRHPSFRMGPGTNFEWQHDAHLNPDGTLTLFDDAGSPQEEPQSSAKTLRLNTRAMTVSLVHSFRHAPRLLSSLAGSMQTLPNHNVLVGWGSAPVFSEYTPRGQLVFDGRFPYGTYTYRVYRFPWVGHPVTRPSLALSASADRTTLYASWNGATEIAAWRVLAGSSAGALRPVGDNVPWSGFETTITRPGHSRNWAVQALSQGGRVLGTSTAKVVSSGG